MDWTISNDVIAHGSFSTVKHATRSGIDAICKITNIDAAAHRRNVVLCVMREVATLLCVNHENIVQVRRIT